MRELRSYTYYPFSLILFILIIITGCSTGIESTKTIKMSKSEREILRPSPEQKLTDSIIPQPLKDWNQLKLFMIMDNRAQLVYESYNGQAQRIQNDSLKGLIIAYTGIENSLSPTGEYSANIIFNKVNHDNTLSSDYFIYNTNKNRDDADKLIWKDLPLLIDLDMVEAYRKRLKGLQVWTKSNLWYDQFSDPVKGSKYKPVTILDVIVGNSIFPLKVIFTDGFITASLPMNMNGHDNGFESRSFSSLFSLSDPKILYPNISPEVWELICKGNLKEGMTKLECKLAIGAPQEVDSGHDWNTLIDFWRYSDGTFLRFQDGVLIDYRK